MRGCRDAGMAGVQNRYRNRSAPRGHPVHRYGSVLAGSRSPDSRRYARRQLFPVLLRPAISRFRISTSGHFGVRFSLIVAGASRRWPLFGSSAPWPPYESPGVHPSGNHRQEHRADPALVKMFIRHAPEAQIVSITTLPESWRPTARFVLTPGLSSPASHVGL